VSRGRGRSSGDPISSKPGRGYRIFVFTMAGFLVIGSVALIIGSALEGGQSSPSPANDERPGEEISRLQTAVANNPDDTNSMAVLANILANEGRVDESIPWYERAVEGDPDNGDLRLAFGLALFQLGNDFDAQLQLQRAREMLPDSASPSFYLGQLYERRATPDIDAARSAYQDAFDIAPESHVGQQAEQRLQDLEAGEPTETP
jgi:tetratricopeptide (TPR) repeat protein